MRRFTSSQPPSATHDGNTETVLRVTYAGDDYQHLSRQSLDLTYSQTKDLREQCQALKANIDTLSKVLEANLNLPRKVQDTLEQIRTSSSCFSSHFGKHCALRWLQRQFGGLPAASRRYSFLALAEVDHLLMAYLSRR